MSELAFLKVIWKSLVCPDGFLVVTEGFGIYLGAVVYHREAVYLFDSHFVLATVGNLSQCMSEKIELLHRYSRPV